MENPTFVGFFVYKKDDGSAKGDRSIEKD